MDQNALCHAAALALEELGDDCRPVSLVGFDGFVDHIIDVVDKRTDQQTYSEIGTISGFSDRVAAAAGRSTNFELVVRLTKIGGNGPIMANALTAAGQGVHYLGILGEPGIDPVFQPLVDRADSVTSLGPAAVTDALEFNDGKLMLGKLTPVDRITYEHLLAAVGRERLVDLLGSVDGVATVNWTMTLAMTDIWRRLTDEILPGITNRPTWFVDLADPIKRTAADLDAALQALQGLQRHVDVVLGMNGSEGRQVVEALGGAWVGAGEDTMAAQGCAVAVRERLGLHCAMVHLVGSAAAATVSEAVAVPGFLCRDPVITTGAGDHFNAGFFGSLLAGLPLQDCCLIGGATSGHYVRSGQSPSRSDLIAFLRQDHRAAGED